MTAAKGTGRIPLQGSRGSVVASIQVDLNDDVLALAPPVLRTTVARNITLRQACALKGVPLPPLLERLATLRASSLPAG